MQILGCIAHCIYHLHAESTVIRALDCGNYRNFKVLHIFLHRIYGHGVGEHHILGIMVDVGVVSA